MVVSGGDWELLKLHLDLHNVCRWKRAKASVSVMLLIMLQRALHISIWRDPCRWCVILVCSAKCVFYFLCCGKSNIKECVNSILDDESHEDAASLFTYCDWFLTIYSWICSVDITTLNILVNPQWQFTTLLERILKKQDVNVSPLAVFVMLVIGSHWTIGEDRIIEFALKSMWKISDWQTECANVFYLCLVCRQRWNSFLLSQFCRLQFWTVPSLFDFS